MRDMFNVRSARVLAPSLQSGLFPRACRLRHRHPTPSRFPDPHLAPHRMPSFRLGRARRRSTSR
eukprot:scaffold73351_cov48-Phaeocystis_antarctica.AAC.4